MKMDKSEIVPFGHFDDCYTRSFQFLFENRILVVRCNKTRKIVQYIFLVNDPYSAVESYQLHTKRENSSCNTMALLPPYYTYPDWNNSVLSINVPTLIAVLNLGILFGLDCFWENGKDDFGSHVGNFDIKCEYLPETRLLNKLCECLGRKSVLIRFFCIEICSRIREGCSGVIDARAVYVPGKENYIQFVVISKTNTELPIILDRPIVHRYIDDVSSEASFIIQKEKPITEKQRKELRAIIDTHTDSLLRRHTNITLISISSIKSKNFENDRRSLEYTPCIVFYVSVKGLIPIGEDLLPKSIEGYQTDIREGSFTPYVLKSHDVHEQVKMGCLIQGLQDNTDDSGQVLAGTLGGFIDHPDFGLCCFTSAHVMLSDKDMNAIGRRKILQLQNGLSCYQPCIPYKFGSMVLAVCNTGNENCPGVEVVMIKVEGRNIDYQGRFPGTDEIAYRSGEILEIDRLLQHINDADICVIKYGAQTGITRGRIHSDKTTMKFQHGQLSFELRNQIEVIGDEKFAEPGDSGALVFHCSKNMSLKVIGVVEGGTSYNTYIITPICAILKNLGMPIPLRMKVFENRFCENCNLENMEQRLCYLERSTEGLKSDVSEIKTKLMQQDQKLDQIIAFLKR